MRADEEIKKDIVNQLTWDTRVDASNIKVKVDNNKAILEGTVPFYTTKNAAENIACSVFGVYSIEDNLDVKFPAAFTVPTDSDIKNYVENYLEWNALVDESSINIGVTNGIVTLEGSVPSFGQKLEAEVEAQSVAGVKEVKSKLAVAPTEEISDEVLGERIMDRIEQNTMVDVNKIDIKVKEGKVTLSGTVPNWYMRTSVYNAARYTLGVKDVEDNIAIKAS